ncbi:MAG: hypothetical protein IJJ31_02575 [Mogibacterium sp.]|nr:hypothetical protein [Mogibacterium sp.]
MNNKRGGAGAKIILVLILMIASAVGGAYGYRVVDGKFAVREANKIVDSVKVSDYDAPENTEIQGYIDNAKSDLETASTRKEVYEILVDFRENVSGVLTRTQKELAEARKAAEEAKNNRYNDSDNSNNGYNNDSGNYGNGYNNDNSQSGNNNYNYDDNNGYNDNNSNNNNNNNNNSNNNSDNSSNDSNNNSGSSAITNDDGTSGKQSGRGLLNSLLGGDDN